MGAEWGQSFTAEMECSGSWCWGQHSYRAELHSIEQCFHLCVYMHLWRHREL